MLIFHGIKLGAMAKHSTTAMRISCSCHWLTGLYSKQRDRLAAQ